MMTPEQRGRHNHFAGSAVVTLAVVVSAVAVLVCGWWEAPRSGDPEYAKRGAIPAVSDRISKSDGLPASVGAGTSSHHGGLKPGVEDAMARSGLKNRRNALLEGHYGRAAIGEVIRVLNEVPGGPELQTVLQALALRKGEALPMVKERLRTGDAFENHMLTKFLRLYPWPETRSELLALAQARREQWLPRQGALYALGALGDASVGPGVAAILEDKASPRGVTLAAIATLARIGYREGAKAIRPFAEDEDIHVRLFAGRALAELGEPVDREILLSVLDSAEYLVRQEGCDALASIAGADIEDKLKDIARSDSHEAVRDAAAQALLRREIRGLGPAAKLDLLRRSLETAERHNAVWIMQTILARCGEKGRDFVRTLAAGDSRLAERAFALLVLSSDDPRSAGVGVGLRRPAAPAQVTPKHASTPTHQTLMDFAVSKAGESSIPLPFPSVAVSRMREGARDEDVPADRSLNHAYNPLTDGSFGGDTARNEAHARWSSMAAAFASGNLEGGDGAGAWHFLGRVSHLLQDMTSPAHTYAQWHPAWGDLGYPCYFERYWELNDAGLRSMLLSIGGPLHSGTLDADATERLDAFSRQRLMYRFENSCPYKSSDDVRGWVEVLAWITYFRASIWGEVFFGSSGGSGNATAASTTTTTFSDGTVNSNPNALHTVFDGRVRWIAGWTDNYYEITDRNGYIFRWMSWTDIDDWSSCGRFWGNGYQDSSKRTAAGDDDDRGARITGRFWFDTRELGRSTSGSNNRNCYPSRYPDGGFMTDHLHQYYGAALFPLTVRYNAGLLGLANRRVMVRTQDSAGATGLSWSRKDNFGNGPASDAGPGGRDFYFVAKSGVTLTAPPTDSGGRAFVGWLRDDFAFAGSTSRTITVNDGASPIPANGVTYLAQYEPPRLGYAQVSPEQMRFSWATNWTGSVLETSARLGSGEHWTEVSTLPVMVDGMNTVTVNLGEPSRFFRLRLR